MLRPLSKKFYNGLNNILLMGKRDNPSVIIKLCSQKGAGNSRNKTKPAKVVVVTNSIQKVFS